MMYIISRNAYDYDALNLVLHSVVFLIVHLELAESNSMQAFALPELSVHDATGGRHCMPDF